MELKLQKTWRSGHFLCYANENNDEENEKLPGTGNSDPIYAALWMLCRRLFSFKPRLNMCLGPVILQVRL